MTNEDGKLSISKAKPIAKKKVDFLKQLHIYCNLATKTMASSILLAFILWLFLRFPEPKIHVTSFVVDRINDTNSTTNTFFHYNITLHNPDLYKSLNYTVLFMRINYSDKSRRHGASVDFDGIMIHQRPTETTILPTRAVNYTDDTTMWISRDGLIHSKTSIDMRFVFEAKILVFNRPIGTRQRMRTASVYFDDAGNAFLNRRYGLRFK